ncbi:LysR family transcriptional regulator [Paracandidimonas soli]|uniref:LysR family transcriptional regulator n=1 Tax=Paracandidimonas soli TaxID=1917182 RepID=A0A4R3V111_9BURK|nr:LysR family transcriptional regulator [Paracandidimonas soli]
MFKPSLVHLETAVWISRLGSYAAAAAQLNTTQPTVSSRIKELEERLGIQVFEKTGRRMVLTVKGRTLVDRCAPLLDRMEGVLRSVTDTRDMHGTLRLGCGEIFAMTKLAGIMKRAREAFPNVNWEIDVDLTINLKSKLQRAALDMAIMVSTDDDVSQAASLSRLNLAWMADMAFAKENDLGHGREDLARVPVWTLSRPSLQYGLTAACLPDPRQSHKLNTCNHVKSLIEVVASGAGIAMLPDTLIEGDSKYGSLMRIFPDLDPVPIEFYMAKRSDTHDSLVFEAFDFISLNTCD